jgi:hypothetical protein
VGQIFERAKEELGQWEFLAFKLSSGREYECEEILRIVAKMRYRWMAKAGKPPAAFLMSEGMRAAVCAAQGYMVLHNPSNITAFGVPVECMKAGESLCGANILLVGDFVRRRAGRKVEGHSVGYFVGAEMREDEKTQASLLKVDASNGFWTVFHVDKKMEG